MEAPERKQNVQAKAFFALENASHYLLRLYVDSDNK